MQVLDWHACVPKRIGRADRRAACTQPIVRMAVQTRRCRSSRYGAIVMSSRLLRSRSRVSWAADVGSPIRRGRLRDASETASGWFGRPPLTRRGRNNERMRIKVVGTIVVHSSESGFMERTDPPTDGAERSGAPEGTRSRARLEAGAPPDGVVQVQ